MDLRDLMLGNMRHHLYKLARILSPKYLRLMEERAGQIPGKMHPCLLAPALDQRWLGWSSWMYHGNGHGNEQKCLQAKEENFGLLKRLHHLCNVTSSPRDPISQEIKQPS